MSRIGRKPIQLPDNVDVKVENRGVIVKGPKGQLDYRLPDGIGINIDNKTLLVTRDSNITKYRALHGLVRSLVSNMVTGVSSGFKKYFRFTVLVTERR